MKRDKIHQDILSDSLDFCQQVLGDGTLSLAIFWQGLGHFLFTVPRPINSWRVHTTSITPLKLLHYGALQMYNNNNYYYYYYLSHSAPSLPMFPLEFRAEVKREETSHGAILQWRPHDCSMSHFDTVPACDGRTDRQTDRQTDGFTIASTALCIASYADAL